MANKNNLNISGNAGVDGAIPIGSTASTYAEWRVLTPGTGMTIVNAGNSITLSASGSVPTTFTEDVGSATPAANNINMLGSHGLNTSGAGSTVTTAINNTIVLGDLALLTAGTDAITITSGDLTFSGTGVNAAGNINFPAQPATGVTSVINIDSKRFLYNYGSSGTSTFLGSESGNFSFSGNHNIGVGSNALQSITNADENIAIGFDAGTSITIGDYNVAVGSYALDAGTSCYNNVAIGAQGSLGQLLTGQYNIAIGSGAGVNLTGAENGNILINNSGTLGESGAIRIGRAGVGVDDQTTCYIAGTYGVAPAAGSDEMVIIDSAGQLGSQAIPSSGLTWTVITGATQALSVDNGYIANRGAGVAFTLPATASVGDVIRVATIDAGGWSIAQNAGQTIRVASSATTTGVGGSLASTANGDSVELVCTVANTDFMAISIIGNITVV